MKGVFFGQFHTWTDFNLVMTSKEISAPQPKTHFIEIEGADSSLDFSEAFGEIKYKRRKLEYEFTSLALRKNFWTEFTRIQNILHGKEFRIIDDEDPEYYYVGRVTIDKWKIDKVTGSFKVSIDAEPYKYKLAETIRTEVVAGTKLIAIVNDRKTVNPIFNVTAPMTIIFRGTTYSVSTINTDISTDLVFTEGNNNLEVRGDGTITIRYQEGAL